MPPKRNRAGRVLLRVLVLLQVVLLLDVAATLYSFFDNMGGTRPGAMMVLATLLACSAVALRATFVGNGSTHGHRVVFMGAQGLAAVTPTLARGIVLDFVAPGGPMQPDGTMGPHPVLGVLGIEMLVAAGLAGLAVMLAYRALPASGRPGSTFARPLLVWMGAAAVAAVVLVGAYSLQFERVVAEYADAEPVLIAPK
ncbi:MAG: hypothetical protein ABR538_02720 [Candidatus Binatia bacterium]